MKGLFRKISTLGVIGAGQMGTGIAIVGANTAKLNVKIFDNNQDQNSRSSNFIESWLARKKEKGEIVNTSEVKSRIVHHLDLQLVSECDFIIEAISENPDAKCKLFRIASALLKKDAVLASNTSSISITKLAAHAEFPQNVIGMHFMNPVPVMTLIEVIKGLQTSEETLKKTLSLAKLMGKVCTESLDRPGFIANRILMPYINEAIQVLSEGIATKEDIDTTMKLGTNVPMGPLQLADFIGLDTCLSILQVLHREMGDSKYRPSTLLVNYVNAGWLGKKTKKGFYEHASYWYGEIFRLPIPKVVRPFVYDTFSLIFGVDLSEIQKDPIEYETLNDFFTRELKEGARIIDSEALVSPSDGKIASLGVVSNRLESIKGRDYSLTRFLTGNSEEKFDDYRNSLKMNPENELYYVTIYLAPGDYHRFHAPTEWEINYRRHLYGYLLGVFSWNLWRKPDIFTINERVAYFGKWKFGALHYVAVGAYNVGSISVKCDPELKTNKMKFDTPLDYFQQKKINYIAKKGEEFGMFNTGSTIVMIFEAPKGLQWKVNVGDTVKLGNKLVNLF